MNRTMFDVGYDDYLDGIHLKPGGPVSDDDIREWTRGYNTAKKECWIGSTVVIITLLVLSISAFIVGYYAK